MKNAVLVLTLLLVACSTAENPHKVEESRQEQLEQSRIYYKLGMIQYKLAQYNKTLEYFLKVLEIKEKVIYTVI